MPPYTPLGKGNHPSIGVRRFVRTSHTSSPLPVTVVNSRLSDWWTAVTVHPFKPLSRMHCCPGSIKGFMSLSLSAVLPDPLDMFPFFPIILYFALNPQGLGCPCDYITDNVGRMFPIAVFILWDSGAGAYCPAPVSPFLNHANNFLFDAKCPSKYLIFLCLGRISLIFSIFLVRCRIFSSA